MAGPFAASNLVETTEFYLGGIDSYEQVKAIHKASKRDLDRFMQAETVVFVIGNYADPLKDRVELVREGLTERHARIEAFILDEVDPDVTAWENFYVKFRVLLEGCDAVVAVFEDNDGGHELELGEADLSSTYVLKRDYTDASIDADIERERYDAMLGTLFEMMDDRNRLHTWQSSDELIESVDRIGATIVDT